jgi:hypothetical protein
MPRPFGTMLRAWNKVVNRLTGFSAGQLGERLAMHAKRPRVASA